MAPDLAPCWEAGVCLANLSFRIRDVATHSFSGTAGVDPWGLPPPTMESEHKAVLTDRFSIIYSHVLIRACFVFSFEFPLSIWAFKSIVYVKVKIFFFCYEKKNKISRALSPFCLDAARIALEWLFPFFLLFVSLGVLCFFFFHI